MKITVVGGGSTYTPELVDGLTRLRATLPVDEIALVDPAAERLDVVAGMCRRLLARQNHPAGLTWTTDLDTGCDGADIVVLQLRVGGQNARISDETVPLECGCLGQETTGAGGLAKALRTVPVVTDIAHRVRRRAPGAWLVDFTNPVGIVTRALLDEGHSVVGLCNNAIGNQRRFAGLLGVDPDAVHLDHVGLNHLTWERAVYVDGQDVLPKLLAEHGDEIAAGIGLPRHLLDLLGLVPSGYLRYFYAHDAAVAESRGNPRGRRVAEVERRLLDLYGDPATDTKPDLLIQRGGAYYSDAAIELIAALTTPESGMYVADVRNNGALAFLPDTAVVEVPCDVDTGGARPARTPSATDGSGEHPDRSLPPEVAALITRVAAYEELAVHAARYGGRDRVFRALLAHPLVGQVDAAELLTDRLLAANADFLDWVRGPHR